MSDPAGLVSDSVYRPLWLTYGLVPLLAGLDKFFGLLADWSAYTLARLAAAREEVDVQAPALHPRQA
jgi:hypothetical protein